MIDGDAEISGHGLADVGKRSAQSEINAAAHLRAGDMLILTADHGCDPTTPSTDHTREYVPLLVYTPGRPRAANLGTRATLSDIGQTVAENFGVHIMKGTSFLSEIL